MALTKQIGGYQMNKIFKISFSWKNIDFLGVKFDDIYQEHVIELICNRINWRNSFSFCYVVTPNADHLVRLHRNPERYELLYKDAWLRLLDSRVVANLAKVMGFPNVPAVVTGSDLTAALVRHCVENNYNVTILGLTDEDANALALNTGLKFRHYNPPMGFEYERAEFMRAVEFIEENPARLILLAVGSPRQEMVARELAMRGKATGTALCIGASLGFLAGSERRAPVWLQRAGFEWAWRLAQNPGRMWRRYLVDCPAVLQLLWQERKNKSNADTAA
jgi:exopolysaccharide biosynthesis WecB/TagA/CpsF family protein